MKKITFYDTETTDLPNWKIPSDDKSQPHLVSLCAIQCDEETERVIQWIDLVIKSEGWESKEKALMTHGITREHSIEVGVDEKEAVKMLLNLCDNSIRVSHNRTFDQRLIRIALKRYFDEQTMAKWAEKESHICTMLTAKDVMSQNKWPTLSEAYWYFFGKGFENAHSSAADTEACMKIYFAMKKAGANFR